jgi:hypothetical protein
MSMNYQAYPSKPPQSNSGWKIAIVLLSIFIGTPILLCCLGGVGLWWFIAFPSPERKVARARHAWERVIKEQREYEVRRANREMQAQAQHGTVGPSDMVDGLQAVYDDLRDNKKIKDLKSMTERIYGPAPPDLAEELNGPTENDDDDDDD